LGFPQLDHREETAEIKLFRFGSKNGLTLNYDSAPLKPNQILSNPKQNTDSPAKL
jgi:hypothetical protein